LVVALALLCLAPLGLAPARADAAKFFEKVGTFDGQFMKIPIGARATGMGGAFVAVADDASSVFWNPAGVARLSGNIVSVHHLNWVTDINLTQGTYVFSLGFLPGMLAFNARSLYMDDMERTTVYRPDGDGTFFDAGYSSFGLTYARSLTDKFSVGITGSLVHAGLDDLTSNAIAFDVGTLYDTGFRSLKIGMQIANMGSELSFIDQSSKLPILFRVGAAINVMNALDHKLVTTGEFSHPPDNNERMNWGAEYSFKDFFFVRGGYNFGYDIENLSGGLGVRFPSSISSETRFDYSYTDLSDLSGAHRFSLEILF
jgi:long-subunit fatty acid transport protein